LVPYAGNVFDATKLLVVTFTTARCARNSAKMEFNESATGRTEKGNGTVAPMQAWISQNPTNLDVVAPIKARACDALQAVLRSRPPRQKVSSSRIMARGVERC
jgi:hypothetical protein